ncbi:MAG: hypothetical protein ACQEUM_07290 [Pseudomonadota bacterium]
MRHCYPIGIDGERPKTCTERLREGKSLKDGLAGRADMYESEWDRPLNEIKPARRIHHTTRSPDHET